ncbi:MAG TPA: RHS repeat-associated core domain-containing protein, partial [Cellvibrio sp.]|nr:RHS repeat-associated core domain-containing protein [Cellvibrio sp.]
AFEDGFYPLTIRNTRGHVTTQKYDKRFGLLRYTRDANGLESSVVYDALGRPMEETSPTGALTRYKSYYCPTAPVVCPEGAIYVTAQLVTHSEEQNRLGQPLVLRYFDLLQREIRTETFGLDGSSTKQDRIYDARGRLEQQSDPYRDYPESYTTYARYNPLGEAVEIHQPDGGRVTIENWQEGTLYVTEETVDIANSYSTQQQVSRRYTNALMQLVQAEDALGQVIDYTYDSQGNLTGTVMNSDSLTRVTLQHDVAGNKTYLQDPAAGKIDYVYNGFGELRQQIWQKGTSAQKSQRFDYDTLGRMTSRVDTAVGGSTVTSSWLYDTLKKGLITSQSGNGYSETFAYNSLAQVTGQTTNLEGLGSKSFSYTYDGFGRIKTTTYPSGLVVEQVYHAAGIPARTLDATNASAKKVIWALGDTQDDQGNYTLQIMGNGVVTRKAFDPLNGRLREIVSGKVTGSQLNLVGTLQNLSYDWDSIGNLQYRQSRRLSTSGVAIEDLKEGFEYDDLNRLDFASTAGLSLTPRARDYQYDAYGNLRHNGVGELRYERTNGASVYGVTTGNGKTYRYDAYGNVTQRGSEIYEYNVFNKPTRLQNANFRYGPNQEKYWQNEGGVTTWTFAGGLYEVVQSGTTTTEKSYAGSYLHLKTGGTVTRRYLLHDHLGNVETVTDELGQAVERMSFEPFGSRQQADWQTGTPSNLGGFATKKGFTGHDMLDSMKLIHMGGRVYDPVVGRFLSADLFVYSAADTQSYNRYSYVRNNPLSAIDPTGYAESRGCKKGAQSCADRGSEAEAKEEEERNGKKKNQENGSDQGDTYIKAGEILAKLKSEAEKNGGRASIAFEEAGVVTVISYSSTRAAVERAVGGAFSFVARIFGVATKTPAGVALAAMITPTRMADGTLTGSLSGIERAADGFYTFYHGTDVESALYLLNGGVLLASLAQNKKIDGPLGFYLSDNIVAAEYFAARREGTILRYEISMDALLSLIGSGAAFGPIPRGGVNLPGNELFIPPSSFPLFDGLRGAGQIRVTPGL